jgi:hypothetical protein
MRIRTIVSASALVLASLLGACGQRDQSGTPPAGGTGTSPSGATGTSPSATTPSPATPSASAASR